MVSCEMCMLGSSGYSRISWAATCRGDHQARRPCSTSRHSGAFNQSFSGLGRRQFLAICKRRRSHALIEALGFPAVSVPVVNFDNNHHGENENLRLGHFVKGIHIIGATLGM